MTGWRAAAPLVCSLAGVVILFSGAGCSLVLSFDDPVIDGGAGGADAADAADPADGADIAPDEYEPNETPTTATPIEPGTYADVTISPADDVDYYTFSTPGGGDVTIDVAFTHATGDIDVRLFNSTSTTPLGASASEDDDERIPMTGTLAITPGTYYINVYSARGANVYDLTLTLASLPPPDAPITDGP